MAPCDVAVIGGGASGLAAAIAAARAGARACVLERDVEAGLPILATGNGRCNVSNAHLDPERYRHPEVARTVMGERPEREIEAFFNSMGLIMAEESEGRLYPLTRRAESVRYVLLAACEREGVEVVTCAEVSGAQRNPENRAWRLAVDLPSRPLPRKEEDDGKAALRRARKALAAAERVRHPLDARAVVIAPGGASESLCELFAVPHLAEEPLLCPLACLLGPELADATGVEALPQDLDGLRAEAALRLSRGGAPIASEQGELLFRPYGISGIAAFDLSRRAAAGDVLEIDFFPTLDREGLLRMLQARTQAIGPFTGGPRWFDGMLARPLGRLLARAVRASANPLESASGLLHALPLRVTGTAEVRQAQVRRGGIPFDAVELPGLAVTPQRTPALFACGEALDMDADCGGFNLAWAWLSGIRAGRAAAAAARKAIPAA